MHSRFQDNVDVTVDERFLGGNDGRALEIEVVVETVKYKVHAIGGDAVDEVD